MKMKIGDKVKILTNELGEYGVDENAVGTVTQVWPSSCYKGEVLARIVVDGTNGNVEFSRWDHETERIEVMA